MIGFWAAEVKPLGPAHDWLVPPVDEDVRFIGLPTVTGELLPTKMLVGGLGMAFMTTFAEGADIHVALETVKLYVVPAASPVTVVLVPVPVMPPGLIVHVPVLGRSLNTTLPVGVTQDGCVIVPTVGAVIDKQKFDV